VIFEKIAVATPNATLDKRSKFNIDLSSERSTLNLLLLSCVAFRVTVLVYITSYDYT
jgi:hypothetical protein